MLEGIGLGRLEADDDGPELGAAETLGDTDGELEGPADDWDEGPAEGTLLKLGLLEGIALG